MTACQPTASAIVHRDMKPENIIDAARRQRLTRAELAREDARVHVARPPRACLCGPGELCFCEPMRRELRKERTES